VELLSYLETEVADHSILVMELCSGSLQSFLRREGVLPVQTGVNMIESLFIGLAYIHACCIVHCDISMANILLSQEGDIRIADFGLMRRAFPQPAGEWRCRREKIEELVTLWYRCPELILGCTTFSGKVDVFSAGAVFVQLITGEVAFPGDSEIGTLFRIYKACGSPTTTCSLCELAYFSSLHPRWPCPSQCMNLPGMNAMLGDHFSHALRRVLAVAPEDRATAQDILVQFWSTRCDERGA
jgi:serine/threonine protein kinase